MGRKLKERGDGEEIRRGGMGRKLEERGDGEWRERN